MNRKLICQILNHEMMLATGCTEPAAIALTAAIAREQLDGELEHIKVRASANIIKNAMSAGIPGTNYTGINYAAALGAVPLPDGTARCLCCRRRLSQGLPYP